MSLGVWVRGNSASIASMSSGDWLSLRSIEPATWAFHQSQISQKAWRSRGQCWQAYQPLW